VCVCYCALLLEKCTCGAVTVKELGTSPQSPRPARQPPPLPSSTMDSPSPSSPAVAATTPPIVDGEDRAAAPSPPVVVPTTTDKPRELRRGREEETVGGEGESAPKRRKITPLVSAPPSTPPSPATVPAPVSEAVPTPEVAEVVQVTAKESETGVVVSANTDGASVAVSASSHQSHQSAPAPESEANPPKIDPKPKPAQEEETENPDLLLAAATDDDDVVSSSRKIGIQHILLVYETVGETLQCRMCLYGAFLVHRD
jgi:hypothetical protein